MLQCYHACHSYVITAYELRTQRPSNHTNAEHSFEFCLQGFCPAWQPQLVDCLTAWPQCGVFVNCSFKDTPVRIIASLKIEPRVSNLLITNPMV